MIKIKLYLLVAGIIGSVLLAGYWTFSKTQSQLENALSEISRLESTIDQVVGANETMDAALDSLKSEIEEVRAEHSRVQDEFSVIRLEEGISESILGSHDLDFLASARSRLIENIINRATADSNECLEILSGNPTAINTARKRPNENRPANSICPGIFDGMR